MSMAWMGSDGVEGVKGSLIGHCAVEGCILDYNQLDTWRNTPCPDHPGYRHSEGPCVCRPPYVLYSFPCAEQESTRRDDWIKFAGKPLQWEPIPGSSMVCSEHFIDQQPTPANPNPSLIGGKLKREINNLKKKNKKQEPIYKPTMADRRGGTCYVPGCTSTYRIIQKWKRQTCGKHAAKHGEEPCDCTPPFSLYKFPSKFRLPRTLQRWLEKIGRTDPKDPKQLLQPSFDNGSGICSMHFVDGIPTLEHPDPEIFPDPNKPKQKRKYVMIRRKARRKTKPVPAVPDDVSIKQELDVGGEALKGHPTIARDQLMSLLGSSVEDSASTDKLWTLMETPITSLAAMRFVILVLCRLLEKKRKENAQQKATITHLLSRKRKLKRDTMILRQHARSKNATSDIKTDKFTPSKDVASESTNDSKPEALMSESADEMKVPVHSDAGTPDSGDSTVVSQQASTPSAEDASTATTENASTASTQDTDDNESKIASTADEKIANTPATTDSRTPTKAAATTRTSVITRKRGVHIEAGHAYTKSNTTLTLVTTKPPEDADKYNLHGAVPVTVVELPPDATSAQKTSQEDSKVAVTAKLYRVVFKLKTGDTISKDIEATAQTLGTIIQSTIGAGPPARPLKPQKIDAAPSSITLSYDRQHNIDDNHTYTIRCAICDEPTPNANTLDWQTIAEDVSSHIYTVEELTAGVDYYFTVKCCSKQGDSEYGPVGGPYRTYVPPTTHEEHDTTKDGGMSEQHMPTETTAVGEPQPQQPQPQEHTEGSLYPSPPPKPGRGNISSTAIRIHYRYPKADKKDVVIGYTIQCAADPDMACASTGDRDALQWETVVEHVKQQGYTIQQLHPNTDYYFRVKCSNEHGESAYSEIGGPYRTCAPGAAKDINEKKYACTMCPRRFSSEAWLRSHMSGNYHDAVLCSICGKEYPSPYIYRMHMKIHKEKDCVCQICGKSFQTNGMLNSHMKRHNNTRNYKCDICDKAFFTKANLTNHVRIHTGERPFVCQYCGRRFTQAVAAKAHETRCSPDVGPGRLQQGKKTADSAGASPAKRQRKAAAVPVASQVAVPTPQNAAAAIVAATANLTVPAAAVSTGEPIRGAAEQAATVVPAVTLTAVAALNVPQHHKMPQQPTPPQQHTQQPPAQPMQYHAIEHSDYYHTSYLQYPHAPHSVAPTVAHSVTHSMTHTNPNATLTLQHAGPHPPPPQATHPPASQYQTY